jgi:hypothetical protein
MTDLKQRLSDKANDIAIKLFTHKKDCSCKGNHVSFEKIDNFKSGFDILSPQILDLVEALQRIGNSTHRNAHNNTAVANEALEKFNKFLGEK